MIIVIQCAKSKHKNAGYFETEDKKKIKFVANPSQAISTHSDDYLYARPYDMSKNGFSWRDRLFQYNETPEKNEFDLLPAIDLYTEPVYRQAKSQFGKDNVYILSAGWGLISGNFLTPNYDITFSEKAHISLRRKIYDTEYNDFNMLSDDTQEDIFFFGSKPYIPLFCKLTQSIKGKRTVFYNSKYEPQMPGCCPRPHINKKTTNWQYDCLRAFLDGKLG